ncbi:YdcF family protein [Pseudofrankia inefficax]|uniref:DUF218 domain-containing protein n=1 Tax=Pseudofrankia inefficax (strain DSM 45817 / CECT 9037 / DDB 130130 / EuI1c) TaxID=298654 RepID=E3JB57_PSEI1|nr:YdcF family protein [Pseudofrankia inefficax]ADP84678.1 protein of unknown function DUF218 [Pseudofrankia inefficax]
MPVAWWVAFAAVGMVVLAACAVELTHWTASRRHFPDPPAKTGADDQTEVIVVLGCPTRHNGNVSANQQWRTKIAVRSRRRRTDSLLVFTGAATLGAAVAEADTMAGYARSALGVAEELIVSEASSRSTRENLAFSTPQLEQATVIRIASNPLHAARARRYLRQSRPDLFARLARTRDYRPFEHPWLKLNSAFYELGRPILRRQFPKLRDRFQGRTRPKP